MDYQKSGNGLGYINLNPKIGKFEKPSYPIIPI
jgi:hypothetical protein